LLLLVRWWAAEGETARHRCFRGVMLSAQRALPRGPLCGHARRCFHDTSVATAARKNWALWMLGYYGEETTRLRNSEALFQSCVNQANRKAWYSRGMIPKEFRPRHCLLLSHIWMVHRRLIAEGKQGKLMQEALFDILWEDTTVRIRSVGVTELLVNKSLSDVQKYSFPMLVSLDQAVAMPSGEETLDQLGAAMWRNLWKASTDMTVEHCIVMADYVEKESAMVQELDFDALCEGRIPWSPVPSWSGVPSMLEGSDSDSGGEVLDSTEAAKADLDSSELEKEEEEGEWREALALDGRRYYWNVRTRESRWDRPE